MSCSLLPLMPPALLISSTTICAVLRSGSPRKDAGPVTANNPPIFIVCAAAVPQQITNNSIVSTILNRLCVIVFSDRLQGYKRLTHQPILVSENPVSIVDLDHDK